MASKRIRLRPNSKFSRAELKYFCTKCNDTDRLIRNGRTYKSGLKYLRELLQYFALSEGSKYSNSATIWYKNNPTSCLFYIQREDSYKCFPVLINGLLPVFAECLHAATSRHALMAVGRFPLVYISDIPSIIKDVEINYLNNNGELKNQINIVPLDNGIKYLQSMIDNVLLSVNAAHDERKFAWRMRWFG